jgi:hypothetical protein
LFGGGAVCERHGMKRELFGYIVGVVDCFHGRRRRKIFCLLLEFLQFGMFGMFGMFVNGNNFYK